MGRIKTNKELILIDKIRNIADDNIGCEQGKYCSVSHEIRFLLRCYENYMSKNRKALGLQNSELSKAETLK